MSAPLAGAPVAGLRPRKRAGGRKRARRWGVDALGLLVFVVMIFPVYWMVSTALKTGSTSSTGSIAPWVSSISISWLRSG